ncbi:MAG: 1-deoxy-D-xylulose-5-phosphate reductoisomerase, partial [Ilumatobacteraceae bacterium]
EPDTATFRGLSLAYAAGRLGGTAPAFMSAANEVAVEAFLAGRIRWIDIVATVEVALDDHDERGVKVDDMTVDHVIDADRRGREAADRVLARVTA